MGAISLSSQAIENETAPRTKGGVMGARSRTPSEEGNSAPSGLGGFAEALERAAVGVTGRGLAAEPDAPDHGSGTCCDEPAGPGSAGEEIVDFSTENEGGQPETWPIFLLPTLPQGSDFRSAGKNETSSLNGLSLQDGAAEAMSSGFNAESQAAAVGAEAKLAAPSSYILPAMSTLLQSNGASARPVFAAQPSQDLKVALSVLVPADTKEVATRVLQTGERSETSESSPQSAEEASDAAPQTTEGLALQPRVRSGRAGQNLDPRAAAVATWSMGGEARAKPDAVPEKLQRALVQAQLHDTDSSNPPAGLGALGAEESRREDPENSAGLAPSKEFATVAPRKEVAVQVARPILAEFMSSMKNEVAQSSSMERGQDPVVRTIELQLEPRELGQIVVRMTLVRGEFNIEISAAKPIAVDAIKRESANLVELLKADGVQVDLVSVQSLGERGSVQRPVSGDAAGNAGHGPNGGHSEPEQRRHGGDDARREASSAIREADEKISDRRQERSSRQVRTARGVYF